MEPSNQLHQKWVATISTISRIIVEIIRGKKLLQHTLYHNILFTNSYFFYERYREGGREGKRGEREREREREKGEERREGERETQRE